MPVLFYVSYGLCIDIFLHAWYNDFVLIIISLSVDDGERRMIMAEAKTKKKKKWPWVLLTILVIIGALVGFLCMKASSNMKIMNETIDEGLSKLSEYAEVTPVDAGEYSEIKLYGLMKFDVDQYDVSDLGNLSVMKVNMGFMQMASFIITPYEKNMPLLSMDFMYIGSNRKAYVEFYDLVKDTTDPAYVEVLDAEKALQSSYSDLEELTVDPAWYDDLLTVVLHKVSKDDARVKKLFVDSVDTYMQAASKLEQLTDEARAEKLDITQKYCDDLVSQGGVSTNVFKKELGEDTTMDFFNKVFFGTERYKK